MVEQALDMPETPALFQQEGGKDVVLGMRAGCSNFAWFLPLKVVITHFRDRRSCQ